MPATVVLVCRRGPDWASLSRDFRSGGPVHRSRYLPKSPVEGFPDNAGDLVDMWNRRFSIDYFSFRAVLGALTEQSVAGVAGAVRCDYDEVCSLANAAAHRDSYFFLHDDDDLFAPSLASAIRDGDAGPDAIVCPVFRVGPKVATVVRDWHDVDHVWGERRPPLRRYQTNNYGIQARHYRVPGPDVEALKDHASASAFADARGFVDRVLPEVLCAIIKTPSSISRMPHLFEQDDDCRDYFESCIRNFTTLDLPESFAWVAEPACTIGRLIACVHRGDGYDTFLRQAPQLTRQRDFAGP